ncbi:DUF3152 domain-containing protein [Auraticoccus monumenti]|uniref:DUF3152 domain-containing protein n=1 Tax=Auraticoccus monumenti TaxID=675864 RepID=A0A1G6ST12_9ACTN|nr:DUF3152 domain-containing protein [Auraticoccus monumenti]SDD19764.1 Protein of unknown function [Auraticoccus monumenti]
MLVAVLLLALPGAIIGVRTLGAAQQPQAADVPPLPPPSAATPTPTGTGGSEEATSTTPGPDQDAEDVPDPDPSEKAPKTPSVPASGPQEYVTVDRPTRPGSRSGQLLRYRVLIEENLDLDPGDTGGEIAATLDDERSWTGDGSVRFQLVEPGDAVDFTVYVVTPGTTDVLCAPLQTRGEVSCRNGDNVVLNAKRWVLGAKAYGDDITNYRRYLVNHEVGHRLGYDHVDCPGEGEPAPIMLQQTKGVGACEPHPWVKSSDR